MAFERFTKTGRGYIPKASIWRRGQIGLNQGAVQRFGLDSYRFAILFYDRDTDRIGIRYTNDENEVGITKLIMGKTGAIIAAKAFLDYYSIDYAQTRKYDLVFDNEHNVYVIEVGKRHKTTRQ